MFIELIKKNRSYRRFFQDEPVSTETLKELLECARLSPSGSNVQPLKYILSNTAEKNAVIFDHLAWAGYLTDWDGPEEGERPAGYIIILGDKEIRDSFGVDHGIAAQSILLGAVDKGLGGCIFGSIQRKKLREALNIPSRFDILLIIALGKPKETVVLEDAGENGDIKYYRDEKQVHHVPKRTLDELIFD